MSSSGIGQRQIETFMAVLGVPALHSSSMKASENEMASHMQSVAEETCTEALMEEVQLINKEKGYCNMTKIKLRPKFT